MTTPRPRGLVLVLVLVLAACSRRDSAATELAPRAVQPVVVAASPVREARLPRAPGAFAPSLVAITDSPAPAAARDASDGAMLTDVESCGACHPDAAAQWSASAHSFASFGNPIYRFDVEELRATLGKPASQHCAGCHDLPLLVDGLMTASAVPADDLRAHSGVTCRLCHAVRAASSDGNASYAWSAAPLDAPVIGNAASIARHRAQVTTVTDDALCIACHRGFLSPDLALPVHLTGIDEPGAWRSSAWSGNGTARVDDVRRAGCIDCHMRRVPASPGELGAKVAAGARTFASHRFIGGHTWMAAMRGDREQLALTRANLVGVASIDVAGVRVAGDASTRWQLPDAGFALAPGAHVELDVVIRNLLVGHRFPGGVLDVADTWVEVEVRDRSGALIASSGTRHASAIDDTSAHVLRTLVVDDDGTVLDRHEVARFRAQVASLAIAPRDAQAVRYTLDVPRELAPAQLPLIVTARLRHRTRSLALQRAACTAAMTPEGRAFARGGKGARSVELDPCAPQPITEIAAARVELGAEARPRTERPAWQRAYEHGMALAAMQVTRVGEARAVLDDALARAPDARARAQVLVQRAWVDAKLGRVDEVVAEIAQARAALGSRNDAPAALDAVTADAFVRANRWRDAVAPARACNERAPESTAAWSVYARVLVAVGDHAGALAAAVRGLALSPRDPDLLQAQATALAALRDPRAPAAQAAATRFRAPEQQPGLRIRCAARSPACARDRNPVHTIPLVNTTPAARTLAGAPTADRRTPGRARP